MTGFSKKKRSGHVMLPFHGLIYLYVVFGPVSYFGSQVLNYLKAGGEEPEFSISVLFGLACSLVVIGPVALITLIALPMIMGEIEASAERIGLGASQLFSGKSLKEVLCRESFRLGFLLFAAFIGFACSRALPETLQGSGFFAFWQIAIMLLFLFIVAPVLSFWNRSLGFSGDPNACYHHVF